MDALVPLPLLLPFLPLQDLQSVGLLSHEASLICESEWRLRLLSCFGEPRFATCQWRRCFMLRRRLKRQHATDVQARVYLMNSRGETCLLQAKSSAALMCSRERAVVYGRCKRMFDLSLRINRSIQEISALLGAISVDEARGLLNEHVSLMASVAALRGSLRFDSELFADFPAPVLLDTNALLRATHKFEDQAFLDSSLLMMQVWASVDGLIYRPLSPPAAIHETEGETYATLKLHELSGMTIDIDDNTLRYRLQRDELCVNALVSNTYLLYLFNPLQFRPLDWTYDAVLQIGEDKYSLPVQREGVFLNTTSYALRVFLSYGKLPEKPAQSEGNQEQEAAAADAAVAASESSTSGRGAEDSDPLEIPYDGQREVFAFHLTATNRVSKETRVVASKATCLSLLPTTGTSRIERRLRQQSIASSTSWSDDEEDEPDEGNSQSNATPSLERHVHLPYDAMICYCFAPNCRLQYVEFAIGFEPLMHRLGVADFLPDASRAC